MKKSRLIISGLIIFFVIIGHLLADSYLFKHLELILYDVRSKIETEISFSAKKYEHDDKNIVIIAIDDYSLKELAKNSKNQSWEAGVWKNIVKFIEKGQPKALMFNMVFEKITDEPWYNRTFADNLQKYDNIVLGTYLDEPLIQDNNFTKKIVLKDNDNIPAAKSLDVEIDDKKLDDAITYTQNSPVNNLYTKYNTMGVVNSVLDDDSAVRKNQPLFKLVKNGKTYYMPSLAFAGFMKYMGEEDKIIIKNNKIYYKNRVIPVDENGIVNISWQKTGHRYYYIPISKIILNKGDIKPEFFKDKIVIIGKTATGRGVDLSSIIDSSYVRPEVNAVALDNFINDTDPENRHGKKFIYEIPKPVQNIIIGVMCIIVGLLGLLPQSAFIGFLNGFILIILYISFSFWLFVDPALRIWLPIVKPLYYLAVTAGIVFAFRFYKEITKKASIMNVFGKFVSPKVLATVLKNPDKVVLKNIKKQITVLFCDIKDFSGLCEKSEPEELIENLNELFKEIVNIIFENNGTVDKFIGDCIMAYWDDFNTSDEDAFLAVKTALEIKQKVEELKIKNTKDDKISFDVKIGINTGEAILGLTGTEKIMSYTAMGNAVNIASRLESSCKKLDRAILISKSTYERSKDKIVVLEIGKIRVKGKKERIDVYEPVKFADEIIETDKKTLTAVKK